MISRASFESGVSDTTTSRIAATLTARVSAKSISIAEPTVTAGQGPRLALATS